MRGVSPFLLLFRSLRSRTRFLMGCIVDIISKFGRERVRY